MKCFYCSKDLPEGSQFCPYCLQKFTAETEMVPVEIKPGKKKSRVAAITVALVFILSLFIVFALLHGKKNRVNNTAGTDNSNNGSITEITQDRFVEGEYYVTDENGNTSYPPATYVVVVDESGNVKQGYILPE